MQFGVAGVIPQVHQLQTITSQIHVTIRGSAQGFGRVGHRVCAVRAVEVPVCYVAYVAAAVT